MTNEEILKKAVCKCCGKEMVRGKRYSYEQWNERKYCSNSCRAKTVIHTEQSKIKRSEFMSGNNPMKKEDSRKKLMGENSHLWRGGVTKLNQLLRSRMEFRNWRKAIFERDDYTCQECGKRGCFLNADHIKPFAYFPKLRFELSNGRTLCRECHYLTDTYGHKARQQYEFIK